MFIQLVIPSDISSSERHSPFRITDPSRNLQPKTLMLHLSSQGVPTLQITLCLTSTSSQSPPSRCYPHYSTTTNVEILSHCIALYCQEAPPAHDPRTAASDPSRASHGVSRSYSRLHIATFAVRLPVTHDNTTLNSHSNTRTPERQRNSITVVHAE